MKGFFEQMGELADQYKAINLLDHYDGYLTKEQVNKIKKEIKEKTIKVIELNIPKFRDKNII